MAPESPPFQVETIIIVSFGPRERCDTFVNSLPDYVESIIVSERSEAPPSVRVERENKYRGVKAAEALASHPRYTIIEL